MSLFKITLITVVAQVLISSANGYALPNSGFVPIGRGLKNGHETLHLVSVGRRDIDGYRGFDRVQFYYQNTSTGEKTLIGPSVYLFDDLLQSTDAKNVEEQLQSFYGANGLKRRLGGANYLAVTTMVYRDLFRGELGAEDVLGLSLILYVTGMVMKNATAEHFDVKLDNLGFAFIAAAPLAVDLMFAPFRWIVSQLSARERFNYMKSREFKPLREVALENWGLRAHRLRSKVFTTLKSELINAGTDSLFDEVPRGSFDCGVERIRFVTSERLARQVARENRRGSRGTDNPWHRYPYSWESRGFSREELLSNTSLELKHQGAWRIDGNFDFEQTTDEKNGDLVCLSVALDHPSRAQPLITKLCARAESSSYENTYPIYQTMQALAQQWSARIPGGLSCVENQR